MKKILNPLILFITIGIIGLGIITYKSIHTEASNINPYIIPVKTVSKTSVTLNQYLNKKPVLFVFWASWCSHCEKEVAVINQFYAKHPEIEVVSIQVDDGALNDTFKKAKYLRLDGAANGSQIMQGFGNYNGGIPFIVLTDKTGKVVDQNIGETSFDHLENHIANLK